MAANPSGVNKLRKEMGLDPLEEYLKHFNITFDQGTKD